MEELERMADLVFDLGGTTVKQALVNSSGELSFKKVQSTPRNYLDLLDYLEKASHNHQAARAIGLSVPGIYNQVKKILTGSSAISYIIGKPLVVDLQKRVQKPVFIENDGNCALLGELWLGSAKGIQNVAMYVIGSAVGGAIAIQGNILHGANLNAGELGYELIANNPADDSFQTLGGRIGFQAVLKDAEQQFGLEKNGEILFEVMKQNQEVKEFYQQRMDYLAASIINLQYILDPDIILIGGAVSENPFFIQMLQDSLERILRHRPHHKVHPKILPAQFFNDANLLGASYHCQKELEHLNC